MTFGWPPCLTLSDADLDGPERGELSKLAEFPLTGGSSGLL